MLKIEATFKIEKATLGSKSKSVGKVKVINWQKKKKPKNGKGHSSFCQKILIGEWERGRGRGKIERYLDWWMEVAWRGRGPQRCGCAGRCPVGGGTGRGRDSRGPGAAPPALPYPSG